jgi:Ribonuclease G/E
VKKEIVVNVGEHEIRIAVLEDEKLVELHVERPEDERMVGDMYKGRVTAIVPGMQAAFVEIGMEKAAFLHASDIGLSTEAGAARYDIDSDEDDDGDDRGDVRADDAPRNDSARDDRGWREDRPNGNRDRNARECRDPDHRDPLMGGPSLSPSRQSDGAGGRTSGDRTLRTLEPVLDRDSDASIRNFFDEPG